MINEREFRMTDDASLLAWIDQLPASEVQHLKARLLDIAHEIGGRMTGRTEIVQLPPMTGPYSSITATWRRGRSTGRGNWAKC